MSEFLSQFTFNILWVTLTQKIITHRVLKIHKWFWGDVYESGAKFLKPWQVTDKIIEWIFMQFTFNILWVTLTQKIITHRVLKIHNWFWGDVYESGESFLNHDKWQIKLLSEFLSKSHSTFYQVTLTQKIITHRVSKIHKWFWGDVYESGESFLSHDKWQIKLLSEFFANSHSTFYEWL